ncbi:MAG: hypothetical protein COT15_03850 [Candidatus Diapherotrites archaeon CG08_land_8_20_14_0_20_34_12]|nr:MAG: hypothetical protein COT15_03850 [Candidatus Diapherotrites archaeon CG08_land_8_20_14_0_20_34_12]
MKKLFLEFFVLITCLFFLIFFFGCLADPDVEYLKQQKNLKKDVPCFEGYEKDTNLCFLYDKMEDYFFVTNCKNQFPKKYTTVSAVENESECKLQAAEKYDKIAPDFIPQKEDYPDYNKCNEKICLICEYHCNVNHDLLDWRFDKLTHLYDRLAKLFGREKLLDVPIPYVVYDKQLEATIPFANYGMPEEYGGFIPQGEGDFWTGIPLVQNAEGLSFKYYSIKYANYEKLLHKDYPDYVYEQTFDNECMAVHEMLHAVFQLRYGGFSNTEHIFIVMAESFLGWHSCPERNRLNAIDVDSSPPQSFCDEMFKLNGYPHLYYLCKDYGFDVDDLPKLFDEWDKIKEQNNAINPESKGKLSIEDFTINALSAIVGKDTSKVFNNVCYVYPDYPNCKK